MLNIYVHGSSVYKMKGKLEIDLALIARLDVYSIPRPDKASPTMLE